MLRQTNKVMTSKNTIKITIRITTMTKTTIKIMIKTSMIKTISTTIKATITTPTMSKTIMTTTSRIRISSTNHQFKNRNHMILMQETVLTNLTTLSLDYY